MANAQFDNILACEKIYLGKMQTSQNIRIATKDNVSNILSVGVDSWINSSECVEGEASFSGRSNIRLLYCDESGIPYGLNYNADYNDRFISKYINAATRILFEVAVVDHKTEQAGNVINVRVLLEITAYAFCNNTVAALVGGEDMFVRLEDCQVCDTYGVTQFNAQLSDEMPAENAVSGVLLAESNVSVDEISVAEGVVTIRGALHGTVVYTTEDKVASQRCTSEFTREFPLQGNSTIVYGYANVRNTKVRLELSEDQQSGSFSIESNVCFTVVYCSMTIVSKVADAYIKNGTLLLKKSMLPCTLPVGSQCVKRDIRQTFAFDVKGEKVAQSGCTAVVTRCATEKDSVSVEGVLTMSVLYYDQQQNLQNAMLEVPFSQTVTVSGCDQDCLAWASVTVSDVDVDVRTETVTATLNMCVSCWQNKQTEVISNVEEKAEEQCASAIEIFHARKGQTLWDLAKSLRMSEEEVRSFNPDIADVIADDVRIAVYHKL